MTEMKNICGKIPKDLHEKVREEIELTESSTQKFIQQVIEEHFERLAGKGEMSMGTARTIAVQVSEELFQRLKTVIAKKGMKQKDFLIQIIEEALEKAEAEWQNKDSTEEAEPATGESEIRPFIIMMISTVQHPLNIRMEQLVKRLIMQKISLLPKRQQPEQKLTLMMHLAM